MRALWAVTFWAIFIISACVVAGKGQSRQGQMPTTAPPMRNGSNLPTLDRPDNTDGESVNSRMQEQQMKSRNSDRQKRLEADTDKLVVLVKQLKDQVETQDKTTLQPNDVGKKAEEIEKLAKSVKDRMKG